MGGQASVRVIRRILIMKKIVALFSGLAILFCLTSCDDFIGYFKTETFYYEFEEISQNVERAEIIKLAEDVHLSEINDLKESEIQILKTLDYDKTLELLKDISVFMYADGPFVYNGPVYFDERCVRVWYLDGTFEVYSSHLTTLAFGRTSYPEFQEMLEKYLEE